MKQLFFQNVQGLKKNPIFRSCKVLYLSCFFAGFMVFLILGKGFLDNLMLLNVNSLREIKDCSIDKAAFFQYICWRRMLVLAAGFLFWWWGFGKWFAYGVLGCAGFSMGACMYTCLLRYHFKGIFLWIFLYFPHVLFYAVVLICGMILSTGVFRIKAEKLKFLWQNGLWELLLLILLALGIYSEGYINVALLQNYLQFF